MLAEAFVVAKSVNCRIVVRKLDGVPHRPVWSGRGEFPVFVDVSLGIVRRSWANPPT